MPPSFCRGSGVSFRGHRTKRRHVEPRPRVMREVRTLHAAASCSLVPVPRRVGEEVGVRLSRCRPLGTYPETMTTRRAPRSAAPGVRRSSRSRKSTPAAYRCSQWRDNALRRRRRSAGTFIFSSFEMVRLSRRRALRARSSRGVAPENESPSRSAHGCTRDMHPHVVPIARAAALT